MSVTGSLALGHTSERPECVYAGFYLARQNVVVVFDVYRTITLGNKH